MATIENAFLTFLNTEEFYDFKEFFDASRNNRIAYKDDWETVLIDYFLNYTKHGKRYSSKNMKTLRGIFKKHFESDEVKNVPAGIQLPCHAKKDIDDIIEISFQDVDDEWRRSRFEMSKYRINLDIFDDQPDQHDYAEVLKKESPNNNIMAKKIVRDDIYGVFLIRSSSKSESTAPDDDEDDIQDAFSDYEDNEEDEEYIYEDDLY